MWPVSWKRPHTHATVKPHLSSSITLARWRIHLLQLYSDSHPHIAIAAQTAWRNHKKSSLAVSKPFLGARSTAPRKTFPNFSFLYFFSTGVAFKKTNTLRSSASVFIVESLACDLIFHFKGDYFFKGGFQCCVCGSEVRSGEDKVWT